MFNMNNRISRAFVLGASITTLFACGGGGDQVETVDLGEPTLDLGTFNFPIDKLRYDFDEAFVLDYWGVTIPEGQEGSAEISWSQVSATNTNNNRRFDDNGAMDVAPSWIGTNDVFRIQTDFNTIVPDSVPGPEQELTEANLLCGDASFRLQMPAEYVNDGNINVTLFFEDAEGRRAAFAPISAADLGTSTQLDDNYSLIFISDLTPDQPDALKDPSFATEDEGFDLTRVRILGVEFDANGKDPAIVSNDPIRIDNFILAPSPFIDCVPSDDVKIVEIYGFDFEDAAQGDEWARDFGNLETFEAGHVATGGNPGGAFAFSNIVWSATDEQIAFQHLPSAPLNLTGRTLSVDVLFPSSYVDDANMLWQLYNKGGPSFVFGAHFFDSVSGLRGGEWTNVTVVNMQQPTAEDPNGSGTFVGQPNPDTYRLDHVVALGFRFNARLKSPSITGDVLFDNYRIIEILVLGESAANDDFAAADQVASWAATDLSGSLEIADITLGHNATEGAGDTAGSLSLDASWGATDDSLRLSRSLSASVDLTGGYVEAEVLIPEAYVNDGNLTLNFFAADSQGISAVASNFSMTANEFTAGTWQTVEVPVLFDSFPDAEAGFDLTDIQQMGFEISANGKPAGVGGAILFDNVRVRPALVEEGQ